MNPQLTRGQFLKGAAGAAAGSLVGGPAYAATRRAVGRSAGPEAGPAGAVHFHSRPDLRPPATSVAGASATSPGYSFLGPTGIRGAQAGPLIVDAAGQPVWFQPLPTGQLASNFRVQLYRGAPVLTWWQGNVVEGYGQGHGVILDTSYREIARVSAAGGRQADLHEFLLTPQGTALITCFPDTVTADLSHLGGPKHGPVIDSVIQEIDVASGRLLFEWRGRAHVELSESHASPLNGFDYLHVNSIDLTSDGELLVSARHTWAVYKVSRRTGGVIWRLGGKRSDFAVPKPARFSWQHDARQLTPSLITVFDDGEGQERTETQSRGLVLELDEAHRRARMVRAYRHPQPLLSSAMGSFQALPDEHVIVGWGVQPWVSEFDAEGHLLADLRLPSGCQSYRGMRFDLERDPARQSRTGRERRPPDRPQHAVRELERRHRCRRLARDGRVEPVLASADGAGDPARLRDRDAAGQHAGLRRRDRARRLRAADPEQPHDAAVSWVNRDARREP